MKMYKVTGTMYAGQFDDIVDIYQDDKKMYIGLASVIRQLFKRDEDTDNMFPNVTITIEQGE